MTVYVSTSNLGSGSLPGVMGRLDELAYPAVEISSGHSPDEDSWNAIVRYAEKHKASILLHNHAPPEPGGLLINLANPDPAARDEVIGFLKSRIRMTEELGYDYYSFHAGYRVPYRFGVRSYPPDQRIARGHALEIFAQGLQEVLTHAEARGVHIGVENHVAEKGNEDNLILYDADDFRVLFESAQSEYLHLHLDVGHLKVTGQSIDFDRRDFIQQFRDRIIGAHLHDNDGLKDTHEGFTEDSWFLKEMQYLRKLRYACLETVGQSDADLKRMEVLVETFAANSL